MVELNKTVSWYPEEIGKNRFHQWLSNAKDWAVSRSRFYGTPIPLWVNDEDENDIKYGNLFTVYNIHQFRIPESLFW